VLILVLSYVVFAFSLSVWSEWCSRSVSSSPSRDKSTLLHSPTQYCMRSLHNASNVQHRQNLQ